MMTNNNTHSKAEHPQDWLLDLYFKNFSTTFTIARQSWHWTGGVVISWCILKCFKTQKHYFLCSQRIEIDVRILMHTQKQFSQNKNKYYESMFDEVVRWFSLLQSQFVKLKKYYFLEIWDMRLFLTRLSCHLMVGARILNRRANAQKHYFFGILDTLISIWLLMHTRKQYI